MRYSATAPVKIIVLGAGGTGGYLIPHLYRIAFQMKTATTALLSATGTL